MASTKIFIGEDDVIIQMFLSRILTHAGFEIVGDGRDSESILEGLAECEPDLILLDIGLEGEVDGVDTAAIIKERYEGLPFISLTGNSDEGTMVRARKTEPTGFIFKPIDETQLIEEVSKLKS